MSRLIRFSTAVLCLGLLAFGSLSAQPVSDPQGDVGIGTNNPHASALLDMTSTGKGFLLPRMTSAQRLAIPGPANGLMVYDITVGVPFVWSNASGGFQWDAVVTTGSNLGWLTNGNPGLVDGVNNFLGTNTNVPVRVRTNNTERIRVEADGDVGINETTPSAKLDVVATVGAPAIEANTASGPAIYAQSGGATLPPPGNWGLYGSVNGGPGNVGISGVAGNAAPINNNAGVSGANDAGYGVAGNSVATGFAGVFGNATSTLNPATGVLGRSNGGSAGRFEITSGANGSNAVEISTAGAGDALEVTTTGGGLGIDLNGGAIDGNAAGNALGAGTAAQQLTVRGSANAVIGNTLAGNPTVWDLVVQGDAVTTGLFKVGGSIWIDGVSPTHQINANAPLNIGTTVGDITISPAGGTTTVNSDLVVTNDLIVDGAVQFNGGLTLPSITEGSVLFAGTAGAISQDNGNFFWDDATNRLGVGTNTASAKIDVVETGTTSTGIEVSITNAANGNNAVNVTTNGTGRAGFFQVSNTSSTTNALEVRTNGTSTGAAAIYGFRASSTLTLGNSRAILGENSNGIGVAGLSNTGWGTYGASNASDGVFGVSLITGAAGVHGRNDVTGGYGVWGESAAGGIGVYGISQTGIAGQFVITNAASTADAVRANQSGLGRGVYGLINNTSNIVAAVRGETNGGGYGVQGLATGNGNAGFFQISNPSSTSSVMNATTNGIGSGVTVQLTNASNGARGLDVLQAGVGPGVFSTSAGGNAVWGITSSISAAGVIGDNTFGEAVVGRNRGGNGVGAVVGRNDSSGYGVRGFNTKDGIGVLGQAGISGGTGVGGRFENVNAGNGNDALQSATNGTGWAGNFTNANNSSASKGVRIVTTANQGGNALTIANGTLALSRQHPYASNTVVDDNILVVTTAGNVTIPTGAPLVDGATVWVVNNAGAVITVTNTTAGAFNINPGRAVQLLFVSSVSGANWIPVEP
ncbi:MAG: beta strand repeat-containing protein [Candidatus Kapaibacterium sp.]